MWIPNIGGLTFECLERCEAARPEHPFLEEEVFATLFDLGKEKAPSPNGYTDILAF